MEEKRALHVYETEDRFYVGTFLRIDNGESTLKKGVIIMKGKLPEEKYSEEKIKYFYLEAERNKTTFDVHFNLEKLMNNAKTIFL